MAKLVHSMIRVLDEGRSLDFYRRAFGLAVSDRFDFPDFSLLYLRGEGSSFELELTVNKGQAGPYDLGSGYGHLAVVVDDLDAEHARMAGEGLSPGPLRELKHEGEVLGAFFFIADPDGYRIEVLRRGGRFG